jgi:hypothetical protein
MSKHVPTAGPIAPLALARFTSSSLVPADSVLAPFSHGRPLTDAERQIILELRTQTSVQAGTAATALLAHEKFRVIHADAVQRLSDTLAIISETQEQGDRSPQEQRRLDQFCERQAELALSHFFGVLEVSAHNIALEVSRSLYPELLPEKPRGFLARIFGR